MPLAAGTTALCCPKGSSCEVIYPITCDIQQQNATVSPGGPIYTTALGGTLPSCGEDMTGEGTCCPFGYECLKSGERSTCVLNKDQAKYSSLVSMSASTQSTTITIAVSSFTDPPTYPTLAPTASFNTSTIPPPIPTPSGNGVNKGIVAGSAAAASLSVIGLLAFAWVKRARLRRTFRPKQSSPRIVHQIHFPSTRPGLPESTATKAPHDIEAHKWEPELKVSRLEPELKAPTETVYFDRPVVVERNISVYPPLSEAFSPVELPATPLSYATWQNRAGPRATRISRPRQTVLPVSRFSFSPIAGPGDPDGQPNFF